MPHSSVKWCGGGQGPSSSGGRQALLCALSTFNTGVGIANPSHFCFPFQPHPFPFLAGGAGLNPFAEICCLARLPSFSFHHLPSVAAKLLSSLQREQIFFFFFHWSRRFGFCLLIMVALALLLSWVHFRISAGSPCSASSMGGLEKMGQCGSEVGCSCIARKGPDRGGWAPVENLPADLRAVQCRVQSVGMGFNTEFFCPGWDCLSFCSLQSSLPILRPWDILSVEKS